jgi:hypothetical protein
LTTGFRGWKSSVVPFELLTHDTEVPVVGTPPDPAAVDVKDRHTEARGHQRELAALIEKPD